MLSIPRGTMDVDFYKNALGATELRRWSNDDKSIHVSELLLDGALFHLHEENSVKGTFSPKTHGGVTTTIGLLVTDVDAVMNRALKAGAKLIDAAQDYDYGYRQGEIEDPYGHHWLIEAVIEAS